MNFSPPQLLGEREFCFSKSNWIWSKPSFHYVGNSISVNVGVFSSSGLSTGAGAGGTNRRWSFRSLVLRDLCPHLHEPLTGEDSAPFAVRGSLDHCEVWSSRCRSPYVLPTPLRSPAISLFCSAPCKTSHRAPQHSLHCLPFFCYTSSMAPERNLAL